MSRVNRNGSILLLNGQLAFSEYFSMAIIESCLNASLPNGQKLKSSVLCFSGAFWCSKGVLLSSYKAGQCANQVYIFHQAVNAPNTQNTP